MQIYWFDWENVVSTVFKEYPSAQHISSTQEPLLFSLQIRQFNTPVSSTHKKRQFNTLVTSTPKTRQFNTKTSVSSTQKKFGAEKEWSLHWTNVLNWGGLCWTEGYSTGGCVELTLFMCWTDAFVLKWRFLCRSDGVELTDVLNFGGWKGVALLWWTDMLNWRVCWTDPF